MSATERSERRLPQGLPDSPIVSFNGPDAAKISQRKACIEERKGVFILTLGDDKGTDSIFVEPQDVLVIKILVDNYKKGQTTNSLELNNSIQEILRKEIPELDDMELKKLAKARQRMALGNLKESLLEYTKWKLAMVGKEKHGVIYDLIRIENPQPRLKVSRKKKIEPEPKPKTPKPADASSEPKFTEREETLKKLIEKSGTVITKKFIFLLTSGLLNKASHDLNIFLAICLQKNGLRETDLEKHKVLIVETVQNTLRKVLERDATTNSQVPLSLVEEKLLENWKRLERKLPGYNIQKFVEQFSSHFKIKLPETAKTNQTTSSPVTIFQEDPSRSL